MTKRTTAAPANVDVRFRFKYSTQLTPFLPCFYSSILAQNLFA